MSYIYVQAILVGTPPSIVFRHTCVLANDEHEAYALGQAWAAQFIYSPPLETAFDYIIAIE